MLWKCCLTVVIFTLRVNRFETNISREGLSFLKAYPFPLKKRICFQIPASKIRLQLGKNSYGQKPPLCLPNWYVLENGKKNMLCHFHVSGQEDLNIFRVKPVWNLDLVIMVPWYQQYGWVLNSSPGFMSKLRGGAENLMKHTYFEVEKKQILILIFRYLLSLLEEYKS